MHPHRLDPLSLIAGLVFVAVGAGHLFGFNVASWGLVARAWPLLLVIVGVAILISARRTTHDD
jgi:hypothetical protein